MIGLPAARTSSFPAQALRERQSELLRAEIRQDIAALADYVAAHGDPAAELRAMYNSLKVAWRVCQRGAEKY